MPVAGVPHTINGRMIYRHSPIRGFPDLAGVRSDGVFWACELKSDKGKLSEDQKDWIAKLSNAGAITRVVRTPEEMEAFIIELGGKIKPLPKRNGSI